MHADVQKNRRISFTHLPALVNDEVVKLNTADESIATVLRAFTHVTVAQNSLFTCDSA